MDNSDMPQVIAGRKVQATIRTHRQGGEEVYYVLDNGALVSQNAKIGNGVEIGFGSVIGFGARIGDNVKIDYLCRIGTVVHIGSGTEVGFESIIDDGCEIGQNCHIGMCCYMCEGNELRDGEDIGSFTIITDFALDEESRADFQANDTRLIVVSPDLAVHIAGAANRSSG